MQHAQALSERLTHRIAAFQSSADKEDRISCEDSVRVNEEIAVAVEEEKMDMHEGFKESIIDQVDELTPDELAAAYLRNVALFDELDMDGDEQLDKSEFQDLLYAAGLTLSQADADAAFDKLDADGDGMIDRDEFVMFMMDPKLAPTSRMSASESNVTLLLLHAQLMARMLKRKIKANGGNDVHEVEPMQLKLHAKIGDPESFVDPFAERHEVKRELHRSYLSRKLIHFGTKKKSKEPKTVAPETVPLRIKITARLFPDASQHEEFADDKLELAIKFPKRAGISKVRCTAATHAQVHGLGHVPS